MHARSQLTLLPLVAATFACSSGGAGGAPPPNPNVWVAGRWRDSTPGPMARADRGNDEWVYVTLQALTQDTTKDSVAHATFQFSIQCPGCLFYFRTSRAVDDGGVYWDFENMPPPPHPGPDGFGWVVASGSRQPYITFKTSLVHRRRRPSTLTLRIRSATGFRGLSRDPLHQTRGSPTWYQDLTFLPVTLHWPKPGSE